MLKQKLCTVTLGLLLVQPRHLGKACNPGEFRTAGPELKAGQVAGEVLVPGPVGDHDGIPLLPGQGLDHPVKARATGAGELHHQLGIGAVVASKLPVVEKFNFVHMGNAPFLQKLGIDMAQIVAHRMEQSLFLLVYSDHACTGFRSGTGSGGTGMGAANDHHIRCQSLLDQCRGNGGRGLPPGCV